MSKRDVCVVMTFEKEYKLIQNKYSRYMIKHICFVRTFCKTFYTMRSAGETYIFTGKSNLTFLKLNH